MPKEQGAGDAFPLPKKFMNEHASAMAYGSSEAYNAQLPGYASIDVQMLQTMQQSNEISKTQADKLGRLVELAEKGEISADTSLAPATL
jgi:hypothetical protein